MASGTALSASSSRLFCGRLIRAKLRIPPEISISASMRMVAIRMKEVEPALRRDAVNQIRARRHRGRFAGLVGPVDDVQVRLPTERSPKSMNASVNLP